MEETGQEGIPDHGLLAMLGGRPQAPALPQ